MDEMDLIIRYYERAQVKLNANTLKHKIFIQPYWRTFSEAQWWSFSLFVSFLNTF